jgi:hypothetical protein
MSPIWIRRIWRWLLDIWIICGSLGYPIHDLPDGRDDVHSIATSTDIKDAWIYAFIPTQFFFERRDNILPAKAELIM